MQLEELIRECRTQLLIGRPLAPTQKRKLRQHGFSITDFTEECFRWRDKNLTMLTQDAQIMRYIPVGLHLSIHDARYDYKTNQYHVTYRTAYYPATDEFKYECASFRRLTDIHQFFMQIWRKE